MFIYEKKLQFPVKIATPNPKLAAYIITQYGGPYICRRLRKKQRSQGCFTLAPLLYIYLSIALPLCGDSGCLILSGIVSGRITGIDGDDGKVFIPRSANVGDSSVVIQVSVVR